MGGTCPFCGMASQTPHETQAACIAALHAEIGRTKDVLVRLKSAHTLEPPDENNVPSRQVPLAVSEPDLM
jgi:hypothetical protein